MNLSQCISALYPTAMVETDFSVLLTGSQWQITKWNTAKLGPQPTLADLEAAWPTVQLQQAKTTQRTLLTSQAVAAMTGGFQSSALGSVYTYPSTLTDQHNLSASVVASLLPSLPSGWTTPFWCQNSAGTWAFVSHTAAQIQQVGLDAKTWVTTQQTTLASLIAQVEAATTVSAVQAVTWS
ncbi:MAG: XkdW family protein [Acidithiobacillus sp.]|uniref:XkdW family protein n=1 Tax=Acidithiobacillus sp. TaxID=1872118 RepID=UPI003CFF62B6